MSDVHTAGVSRPQGSGLSEVSPDSYDSAPLPAFCCQALARSAFCSSSTTTCSRASGTPLS